MKVLYLLVTCLIVVQATIYFQEDFNSGWEDRWDGSRNNKDEAGTFAASHGNFYGDADADVGLQTTEDSRFYQISASFPAFSNKGKNLVLQFSVKYPQDINCAGGYVKVLRAGLNQNNFSGDSPYNIMFGPDFCGASRRLHAILRYKENYYSNKKVDFLPKDQFSHLYTLIIRSNLSFQMLVDGKALSEGNMTSYWDFLLPETIDDPSASKPGDWVDIPYIDDPASIKPEGYDDISADIVDPDAEKPKDWDDKLDGEWEAPTIPNPEYNGPWRPSSIPNPEYKGTWEQPQLPNPEFVPDPELYVLTDNAFIGIEVWHVMSGTIFDNFLLTDDIDEAKRRSVVILERFAVEKKAFDEGSEVGDSAESEDPDEL